MDKVAVIGAGISGLSVAHFLSAQGYLVSLFEKESQPGGLIRCDSVEGSLFHTCGGHVFNSKRQDVLDWFWSKFNKDKEFSKADRFSMVFLENGKKIPYPIENHVYLMDKTTQEHFIRDMLHTSVLHNRDGNPSNFEEFLIERFGKTLYDIYFKPYNEKVWKRDLRNVPLTWLEGKLPMPTVEEMIYNNMNRLEEKTFVHSSFWYENANGSQHIANRLAEGLDITYNAEISNIKYDGCNWHVFGRQFDKLIFCGNIKELTRIMEGVDISAYQNDIDALEFHGTTAVFCEIDKNPYSWIYLPSRYHESHRIICTGNFNPSNNSQLISNDRITATVEFTDFISKSDIMDNLNRVPLHPTYITHKYNKYSYPIQNAGTRNMIRELKQQLSRKNLYFTGRFADWEYYNMDTAIGASMDVCNIIVNSTLI